jgi:hypothetical protein
VIAPVFGPMFAQMTSMSPGRVGIWYPATIRSKSTFDTGLPFEKFIHITFVD